MGTTSLQQKCLERWRRWVFFCCKLRQADNLTMSNGHHCLLPLFQTDPQQGKKCAARSFGWLDGKAFFFYLFTPFLPPFFFVPTFFLAFLHTRRRLLFPHVFSPKKKHFLCFFFHFFANFLPEPWVQVMSTFFASYCPISEPLSKASVWRVLSRVMCAKPHTRQACSSLLQHWASFSFFFLSFYEKDMLKHHFPPCPAISRLFFTCPAPKRFTKDRVVKKCQKKKEKNTFAEGREKRRKPQKTWYFPQSCLLHEMYGKDGPFLHQRCFKHIRLPFGTAATNKKVNKRTAPECFALEKQTRKR